MIWFLDSTEASLASANAALKALLAQRTEQEIFAQNMLKHTSTARESRRTSRADGADDTDDMESEFHEALASLKKLKEKVFNVTMASWKTLRNLGQRVNWLDFST